MAAVIFGGYGMEQCSTIEKIDTKCIRVCSICRELKPVDEFGKSKNGKNGLNEACKMCCRRRSRERKAMQNRIEHNEQIEKFGEDENIKSITYKRQEGIITRGKGIKQYYLHTRHNGIWYVEFIDQETRKKMSARSTGKTNKNEAIETIEKWLKYGIPDKKAKQIRSLEEIASIRAILRAISKTKLSKEDGYRIIGLLVKLKLVSIPLKYFLESPIKYMNKYTLEEVEGEIEYIKEAIKYERKQMLRLKHQAKEKLFQKGNTRKIIQDKFLDDEARKLIDLEMQHILLLHKIKQLKQGEKHE
jgi:hypothetical protein